MALDVMGMPLHCYTGYAQGGSYISSNICACKSIRQSVADKQNTAVRDGYASVLLSTTHDDLSI
jgi:hypothetical protein